MLETLLSLLAMLQVATALGKDATDIATSIEGMLDDPDPDDIATKKLISELLNTLIRLQAEQLSMQSTIAALQQEQRRIEQFEAEAFCYAPKKTEMGSIVYELQPAHADGKPIHCICAACYDKRIKSILQPVEHNTFECGTCKGRVFMPDGRGSGIMTGPVRRSSRFDGFP